MLHGAQNGPNHMLIGVAADDGDRPWSNRLVISARPFGLGRHGHSSVNAWRYRNDDAGKPAWSLRVGYLKEMKEFGPASHIAGAPFRAGRCEAPALKLAQSAHSV
jgi:hypothetical protein